MTFPEYDDWDDEPVYECTECGDEIAVPPMCFPCTLESAVDLHADRRDAQRAREVHGMRVSGRSIKSVLLPLLGKGR